MKEYHVSGIGNPLLDLTLTISEDILEKYKLTKGTVSFFNSLEITKILEDLKDYEIQKTPGGSTANVLAGVSSLGGNSALLGKIGNDEHGEIYTNETNTVGTTPKLSKHDTEATGIAITFITPDGERTFAVNLGAALHFDENDTHADTIRNSQILHIEGYKIEETKDNNIILNAVKIAKENGTKVSIDLSDSGLIKRNYDYLKKFIKEHADIVFANEDEAEAFTGETGVDALNKIKELCEMAIVKLGEKGSLIKTDNELIEVPSHKTKVKNTNGAGDMYAAGILYGLTHNLDLKKSGEIASKAASMVVAEKGSRVNKKLDNLTK